MRARASVFLFFLRLERPAANLLYFYCMVFTDDAIVLFRQPFREADRVVSLYTREHGRVNVRFPSVCKPLGKLKALSEPFSCGTYRIYVRRGGVMGTVTGGKIRSVFPHIRTDLKRQTLALHFCELILRLTPAHQPSEEKFELLLKSLTELEYGEPNTAFAAAFTLRLMRAAGFGLEKPVLQITPEFWRRMHEDELSSLCFEDPQDLLSLSKCNSVCRRFLSLYLTYPLHTAQSFALDEETLSFYTQADEALQEALPDLVPAH